MKVKRYFIALLAVLLPTIAVWAMPPAEGVTTQEPVRNHIRKQAPMARRMARKAKQDGVAATRGLLLLVEYADVAFQPTNTVADFDSLMNGRNYTHNGAIGSVWKYFYDQSNGLCNLQFDVVGPIQLPETMAYYGTDINTAEKNLDRYCADLVMDACFIADTVFGVDFTQYDADNDGFVDFVYIIYAGYAQSDGAPSTTIWPHEWDIESVLAYGYTNQTTYYCNYDWDQARIISENLPVVDGRTLNLYACSSELRYGDDTRIGIGTACHEFGHVLGLPDYYITTGDPSMSALKQYPAYWSLMSNGGHCNKGRTPPNLSAHDKYYLGWITPIQLTDYTTANLPADGQTYYAFTHGTLSATSPDTVWYFENRQPSGWDTYLPGWGMLVWRVVYDEQDWTDNVPNDYSTRYALQSADGVTLPAQSSGRNTQPGLPFPGSANVTSYMPTNGCEVSSITINDGIVSFTFGTQPTALGETRNESNTGGVWYDLLGRRVDPAAYHGVVVSRDGLFLFGR